MKSFALHFAVCLLFCATSAFAAKPINPADYTVTVHVSSSRTSWLCSDITPRCHPLLVLNATIDGVKSELQGAMKDSFEAPRFNLQDGFLALGDYKAKLVQKKDPNISYFVIKSYELLMPDGRLAEFQVTGQSE